MNIFLCLRYWIVSHSLHLRSLRVHFSTAYHIPKVGALWICQTGTS